MPAPDFRLLFESLPGSVVAVLPDGPRFTIVCVTTACLQAMKKSREEVLGQAFFDVSHSGSGTHTSAARQALCASFENVVTTRQPDRSNSPVLDSHGSVVYIIHRPEEVDGSCVDTTGSAEVEEQLRESEAKSRFLSALDDVVRPLTDPGEITQNAARLLGIHLGVNRCAYAEVDDDEDTFNLTGDYNNGVDSIVGRYTFTQFGSECLRLMRLGLPYVVEDSEADTRVTAIVDSYRMTRIRSVICVPLLKAGRFVAAMAVHQTTPRSWRQNEIELVQLVGSRCWESIERASVNRELQASERRLRLSQRAGRIGSFEWLIKENRIIWTPELEVLYGLSEGAFEGSLTDWSKRIDPEDAERMLAHFKDCVEQKQPACSFEFRAVLPDGSRPLVARARSILL